MQTMYAIVGGVEHRLRLPIPDQEVLPGIVWGRFDDLLTSAYWRGQAWQHQLLGTYKNLSLGRTLAEELAACLLGGFGMKAELGLAAFARLRDHGLLNGTPAPSILEDALCMPFALGSGLRRYRFPRQKASYLSGCLRALVDFSEPNADVALRDKLTTMPGVGPKTASWIVRNYRGSNAVAIIDTHILRAGRHIGIFAGNHEPQHHYRELERRFLGLARAIATPAGILDGLMWDYMRRLTVGVIGRAHAVNLEKPAAGGEATLALA